VYGTGTRVLHSLLADTKLVFFSSIQFSSVQFSSVRQRFIYSSHKGQLRFSLTDRLIKKEKKEKKKKEKKKERKENENGKKYEDIVNIHSEHRFQAPSSKLCQKWLRH